MRADVSTPPNVLHCPLTQRSEKERESLGERISSEKRKYGCTRVYIISLVFREVTSRAFTTVWSSAPRHFYMEENSPSPSSSFPIEEGGARPSVDS